MTHPSADTSPCNWLDDHSRYCLASTAARVFTSPAIDAGYRPLAAEHGEPAGLLTDNGAVPQRPSVRSPRS